MKFRIFYAPQVFNTWEKLFVLTSDGVLYCEYLFKFALNVINETNINYETFAPKDYSWGKGVEGNKGVAFTNYQGCEKELTWEEYLNLKPSALLSKYNGSIPRQIGWVQEYLKRIHLTHENWDNDNYKKFKNNIKLT